MLAFASLLAVLPAVSLATPLLVERATDISGSPNGFKLPTPRGWADATDSASPCGGISYNATALSDFPMCKHVPLSVHPTSQLTGAHFYTAGGDISILTKADGDRLQINVARTAEATKNSNFVSLLHEVQSVYRGHQCYKAPDFSALGFAVGDAVTLQLSYAAGVKDTILYQVSDTPASSPRAPDSRRAFQGPPPDWLGADLLTPTVCRCHPRRHGQLRRR